MIATTNVDQAYYYQYYFIFTMLYVHALCIDSGAPYHYNTCILSCIAVK